MNKIISLTTITLNSMESYTKANKLLDDGWILLETTKNFSLLLGATKDTKMANFEGLGVRYDE